MKKAVLLILVLVFGFACFKAGQSDARFVNGYAGTKSYATGHGTPYNPATDKWTFGKRHHKTVCLEAHGDAAKWPWLSVLMSYNKGGINAFQRPPGGCNVVPKGQRVIVKTYAFYNGDQNNVWSSSCAVTLPWTYGGDIDYTEIHINLTRATAGHIACRSGDKFSSVAAHEFGHALGLDHTTREDSAMHSDLRIAQPVDVYRINYLYKAVPR